MENKNIVVIGGGFAGTTLISRLEKLLNPEWEIILISEENYMTYTPLLPEVVGASILPGHAVAPLRIMIHRAQFFLGYVTEVDIQNKKIRYSDANIHELNYEHVIFACGSRANVEMIPGISEHALPLKTLGDALYLRNRIFERLEEAELESNPMIQAEILRFVIIGGGSSGVEVAGAISDMLRVALSYYPKIEHDKPEVIVLHQGDRVLQEYPVALGDVGLHTMRRYGIDVRLNTRVVRVTHNEVDIDNGNRIPCHNVICTIGTSPNSLIESLSVPKHKWRIKTEADMSIQGAPGLWAMGDCASILNHWDGQQSPPTAQFAVQQAKQLADNIVRKIKGQSTQPFSYRPLGNMASLGHRRAVAHVFGMKLSGFFAWLLWRGFYLMKMPTFVRKLQIFAEWNLHMLFQPDLTALHWTRTGDQKKQVIKHVPERRRA